MRINKQVILTVIVLLLFGALGYVTSEIIHERSSNKLLDGIRFESDGNWSNALEHAYQQDRGNWVCVNVKDMSYEKAVQVCDHEVGHEIFATYCGENNNIDKCINLTKWNKNLFTAGARLSYY